MPASQRPGQQFQPKAVTLACVQPYESYSFIYGPIVTIVALALLAWLLRWTFTSGKSVVVRKAKSGAPDQYGLLVPVSLAVNRAEAVKQATMLEDHNIRCTIAETTDGIRLMVFPHDVDAARKHLQGS